MEAEDANLVSRDFDKGRTIRNDVGGGGGGGVKTFSG